MPDFLQPTFLSSQGLADTWGCQVNAVNWPDIKQQG